MMDMTFHSFLHTFSCWIFFPHNQAKVLTRPVNTWQRKIYLWATTYKVYFVAIEKNPNYTVKKKVNTEPHRANKLHDPEGLKRILIVQIFSSLYWYSPAAPKTFHEKATSN